MFLYRYGYFLNRDKYFLLFSYIIQIIYNQISSIIPNDPRSTKIWESNAPINTGKRMSIPNALVRGMINKTLPNISATAIKGINQTISFNAFISFITSGSKSSGIGM